MRRALQGNEEAVAQQSLKAMKDGATVGRGQRSASSGSVAPGADKLLPYRLPAGKARSTGRNNLPQCRTASLCGKSRLRLVSETNRPITAGFADRGHRLETPDECRVERRYSDPLSSDGMTKTWPG